MKRLKRNCLYQYQGGGYDGCIWEWNFFLMNNKGKFIDLFSSGFAGIDTKQKAIDYINDNRNEINNDYYIINLKNKNE